MIYTQKRVFRAVRLTLVLKTLGQFLGLLVTVLLVRFLTEAEFGAYNTFLSSMAVVGSVFSFGISNTLQRYIPKYIAKGDYFLAKKVVRTAFIVRFSSLVLLCLGGYLNRFELAALFKVAPFVGAITPFLIVILLHFQARMLSVVLSACLFQGVTHTAQLVLVSSKVILYFLLSQFDLDLICLIMADIASYVLMLTVIMSGYWIYIRPLRGGRLVFGESERKSIFRYAVFNNLNDVGVVSLGRDVDVMFLASLDSVESAGAYAFANRLSHSIKQISPVRYFIDVIRPLFFTLDPVTEVQKVSVYFSLLIKLNYIFEIPFACGLYIIYPSLVEYLFDGKFMEYRFLVVSVYLIVIISSFGLYVGLLAQLKERADIVLYSKIFSVLNILGNLFLIPLIGAYGAVLSTLVSTLAKDLFIFYFVRERIPFGRVLWFLSFSTLYWILVVVFCEGVFIFIDGLLVGTILGILFCLVFYFIYIRIGLFSEVEVLSARELVGEENSKLKIIGL